MPVAAAWRRSKESFRERLLRSIEATTKEITEARDRFLNHAPFSHVVRRPLRVKLADVARGLLRIPVSAKIPVLPLS